MKERYNKRHKVCRSLVERVIGLWKGRFRYIHIKFKYILKINFFTFFFQFDYRCLHLEKVQRYDPKFFSEVILACAVLHNILIKNRVPFALKPKPFVSLWLNVSMNISIQKILKQIFYEIYEYPIFLSLLRTIIDDLITFQTRYKSINSDEN